MRRKGGGDVGGGIVRYSVVLYMCSKTVAYSSFGQ